MRRLRGGRVPDEPDEESHEDDEILAGQWEPKKTLALISGKDCVQSTGGKPMKGEVQI
jgi:hypothetical protein